MSNLDKWLLLVAVLPVLAMASEAKAADPFKNDDERTLYTLGHIMGKNIAVFSLTPAELEVVKKGLTDSATGAKPKVDINTFQPKVGELAQKRSQAKAETEKTKSKPFLEKAAKEKGAVKTESGLIYSSIKAGSGASPKATDKVKVHYHGTLIDGTVFDSSVTRGQPAEFPLNQVIPCWTEGVQKMKVGEKAKLVCPSSIAYGDSGRPPTIPAGATLVFEVELLEILKS
jgi:FKBP-type peptidyl-prolyl cis-trans isomerase FkpA